MKYEESLGNTLINYIPQNLENLEDIGILPSHKWPTKVKSGNHKQFKQINNN